MLQNYGIEFEYHNAEYHKEYHEGWREDGSVAFRAGLELFEGDLPVTVCGDRIMDYEEATALASDAKWIQIINYAAEKGFEVNKYILQDVEENMYNCPCKSTNVPCPCPGHEAAIENNGSCHCGLFEKKKQ